MMEGFFEVLLLILVIPILTVAALILTVVVSLYITCGNVRIEFRGKDEKNTLTNLNQSQD